jgi:hypothetical protein
MRNAEEWRDIPGYEGIYEASNLGSIRSKAGKTTHSARHGARVWRQRILKQKFYQNPKGRIDARIDLWKDGTHKTLLVSRLVALAWVDGYKPGLTVNHRDGQPLNNRADNLEWVSLADNIKQGFIDGLYSTAKQIRLRHDDMIFSYDSMAQASRALGRNSGYISDRLKKSKPIISVCGIEYKLL